MQEKYKKGKVKTSFKKQLVNLLVDLQSSISRNKTTQALIDKNISITFRVSNPDPSMIFYSSENRNRGVKSSLERLAQQQLDEKSKQIKDIKTPHISLDKLPHPKIWIKFIEAM
ncbi:MAG: hypothetical protein EBW90_01650 [Rhodobacteraceae bacterium]|nr:hypothetical protein [Paracoccaceae bacterium]